MLVEYSFGNYKSFREKNTLSMLGVKSFKEHGDRNVFTLEKLRILKSVVVYGNNAGGKSNLVSGLQAMKNLVINSFNNAINEKSSFNVEKFLLNKKCESIPSHFEIVFIKNGVRYRYGFEIHNDRVEREWLYHTYNKREVSLFERDVKEIIANRTSFKEGIGLENKTRENVLFISLTAQFNGMISNEVISWFRNINIIGGMNDSAYSKYNFDKYIKDGNFQKWLSLIIQDLQISNITMVEVDLKEGFQFGDKKVNVKGIAINTWHQRYDENNILIDAVPFNLNTQESRGTKKFINLLSVLYDTIKNGKVLIIDELDSRLHTNITRKLIELFHNERNKKAQLIFTLHDVNLLDKELFRRDQIWFAEKDQFGASRLYSLGDFKAADVRNTSSFVKNYVNGKYGAVPNIKIDKEADDIIYG